MRDHDPNTIEEFNGYWNRGDIDTCPPDHLTEAINVQYIESAFKTRDGLSVVLSSASAVLRIYPYFDSGVGDGFLELRADNKIYHRYGGISFGVPSFTTFQVSNAIAGMLDFGFVSINGRAYISPATNNLNGISGEFVYVYDGGGVNMMRKAAGTGPTTAEGAMAVANSATAGHVEAGIHVFGVVYETNSGFLTQIGPSSAYPTVTADGTHKVDITAIPVFGGGGGTLITKRHIVASKLITASLYNNDPSSYQLFFVPGGEIADNTTLVLTVNFFDSELTEDASHLLDLLSSIPAAGGLGTYHNRMIAWNTSVNIGEVLVSYAGEPEAMDAVSGLLTVPKEGTGITYCQEYRDILYVMKFNKIIAFSDNGDVPTSWPDAIVDQGLGCGYRGVSTVGIYGGTNVDSLIMLNDQGIYLFTGSLNTPELSYKIKNYWQTITPLNINIGKISAYTDSLHQQIIIVIPELSTILVGDYSNGLNAEKIKWSKWTFSTAPSTILLFDKDNKLFIGCSTGINYIQVGATADTYSGSAPAAIPNPTVTTALLPPEPDDNFIHFGGVRYRVVGSGNLIPTLYGLDGTPTAILATVAMGATPGREPFTLANLISQRARLEVKTTGINETMKVNRLTLYTKPIYTSFPG